jgi:hypothetical protein
MGTDFFWNATIRENHDFCFVRNMHVNYGITVGLEIHKNWNNFNWKLPELLQAYLFLPKLKFTLTYVVWWGESMYTDN